MELVALREMVHLSKSILTFVLPDACIRGYYEMCIVSVIHSQLFVVVFLISSTFWNVKSSGPKLVM